VVPNAHRAAASRTPQGCHLLSSVLQELGVACAALHSHRAQRERLAALDSFKSGAVSVLLATDVASRGLDIPTVDLVVNYDLPVQARDYVHRQERLPAGRMRARQQRQRNGRASAPAACRVWARSQPPGACAGGTTAGAARVSPCGGPPLPRRVGRTARAGRAGWSLSFVTQYDIELVQKIEALVGQQLQKFEVAEAEVLKGITKVYAARRTAALRVGDEGEGVAGQRARQQRQQRRLRVQGGKLGAEEGGGARKKEGGNKGGGKKRQQAAPAAGF
jgi:superfamily II DNA/RNA helicase